MMRYSLHFSAHGVTVDKFMVKNVRYITLESTYLQVQDFLSKYDFRNFPLVDKEGKPTL